MLWRWRDEGFSWRGTRTIYKRRPSGQAARLVSSRLAATRCPRRTGCPPFAPEDVPDQFGLAPDAAYANTLLSLLAMASTVVRRFSQRLNGHRPEALYRGRLRRRRLAGMIAADTAMLCPTISVKADRALRPTGLRPGPLLDHELLSWRGGFRRSIRSVKRRRNGSSEASGSASDRPLGRKKQDSRSLMTGCAGHATCFAILLGARASSATDRSVSAGLPYASTPRA